MCVYVPVMVAVAKMLMAMLMGGVARIARLNGMFVSVRVHIHKLFYAFELHRAALPQPYYAV
jgi:hypothetical protein